MHLEAYSKELIWLEYGPEGWRMAEISVRKEDSGQISKGCIYTLLRSLDFRESKLSHSAPEANFYFNSSYNKANSNVIPWVGRRVRGHQTI